MHRGLTSVLVVFRYIKTPEETIFEFLHFTQENIVTWVRDPLSASHWSLLDTAERMTAGEVGAQVGRLNIELQYP